MKRKCQDSDHAFYSWAATSPSICRSTRNGAKNRSRAVSHGNRATVQLRATPCNSVALRGLVLHAVQARLRVVLPGPRILRPAGAKPKRNQRGPPPLGRKAAPTKETEARETQRSLHRNTLQSTILSVKTKLGASQFI